MTDASTINEPSPYLLPGTVPYPVDRAQYYREKGYWIGTTHSDLLFEATQNFKDATAVIEGGYSLTYTELSRRSLTLARYLDSQGLSRGDRVVIHLPNIISYFEIIFAVFELGAIPVFALAAHRQSEIEYFCLHTDAKLYITTDSYGGYNYAGLAQTMQDTGTVESALIVPALFDTPSEYATLFEGEPLPHLRRAHPSDVAFLQLSGGTTGTPKLIPRTHDDYLYTIRESVRICGLSPESVHLVVLPVSHNYTMSSPGVLGCLFAGSTIVLSADGSPDTSFALIQQHRVTSVSLVPTIALMWLNAPQKKDYDLSSLQIVQVGGAKLSEEAACRIRPELGCTLQQVFGMAEGLVNYTRLDDDENTLISTQGLRISPDDEVLITDEKGIEVPMGQEGSLLTRGPYTIRGYYKAEEANRSSFTPDGFYRTGDRATVDERGYLTVTGREKDQINRGGEKVSPEEVENHLLSHPSIHDASVVGEPDELLGEKIKAYISARPGSDSGDLSAFKIKKYLRSRGIAEFKIPEIIELVDVFPETKVGKVNKKEQRKF